MNPLFSAFIVYLSIFLFGITVMKLGFGNLTGSKLNGILFKLTDHPIKGLVVGAAITAIVQSSSAVIVIAVGLAASGLIKYYQTIGIMIGANIGTTVTGEVLIFQTDYLHIVLLIAGVLLLMMPQQKWFSAGAAIFGLGCLFTAMNGMHSLATPLQETGSIKTIIEMANDSILFALLIGAIFTAIIQSSSAATIIAMTFMYNHGVPLETGIIFILGANIGTCVTALLAAVGSNWQARWTAYTHGVFNLAGAILFLPLVQWLSALARSFANTPDAQLAHASVLFNVIIGLLALPFAKPLGQWIESRKSWN